MGDRFYEQQNEYLGKSRGQKRMADKPKRRLKKDVLAELYEVLGAEIGGLDRITINALDELIDAVKSIKND